MTGNAPPGKGKIDRAGLINMEERERDPKQEDGDYERAQKRRMNGVINK